MGDVIVSEFVTLDGVMEAPGGEPTHPHTGWVIPHFSAELFDYKLDEVQQADRLLIGRVTYESFAEAWPERDGPMAEKMNAMPKTVVSTSLRDPAWANTSVVDPTQEELPGAVSALMAQSSGPILVLGSSTLVHALVAHDLVDELRVMLFPVLIGSGLRLFPDATAHLPLMLVDQQRFPNDVVLLRYRRVRRVVASGG